MARPLSEPEPEPQQVSKAAWLTRVAFGGAIMLTIARAMLPQHLRDNEPLAPLAAGIALPPRAAGPAVGVVLDSMALLCAVLVLIRGALDRHWRLLATWSVLPLATLAILAFASTLWASDRFAAAASASTWLAAASLVFVFAQTVRTWARLRVVASVAAGLFLVNVAFGVIYRTVDLPDFRENFEANKASIFEARGLEPGSFAARNFELRVMQGQTGGFTASPNSYAAMLVLLGFTTAGIAWQRWRERSERGWAIVLALGLVPGAWLLWTTSSRTSMATAVLAAVVLAVAFRLRRWLAERRRAVFVLIVLCLALAAGSVVGVGLATGTLPHESLAFRWNYWLGGWGVFTERPLLGVGFANFGDAYLAHRVPVAAEEVKDPHNLFVRFFCETGVVGGVLAIIWLLTFAWEQTRPALRPDDEHRPSPSAPMSLRSLIALVILGIFVHLAAAIDFTADPYFVFLEVVRRGLYLLLILGGVLLGSIRSAHDQVVMTAPAPALTAAVLAGVGAALLHAMVDVVVFETAVLMCISMLMGAAVGIRAPEITAARNSTAWPITAVAVGSAVAFIAFAAFFAFPLAAAERESAAGDDLLRGGRAAPALERYQQAATWSPLLNADYYRRAALAAAHAQRPPEIAEDALRRAIAANPRAISERVALAGVYGNLFQPPRLAQAVVLYEEIVRLNPNDLTLRLSYAQLLEMQERLPEAAEQLRRVLWYNDQLNADEPERLDSVAIEQIEARIEAIETAGAR